MSLSFDDKLDNYAKLVVHVGLGLRPGQQLLLNTPLEAAPFVERVAEHAYAAGSPFVDAIWKHDPLARVRLQHAPKDTLSMISEWRGDSLTQNLARGGAVTSVYAADPDAFAGFDPESVTEMHQAIQRYTLEYSVKVMSNAINWTVVAAAVPAWAQRVFPAASADEATALLWDAIFKAVRADQPDPIAAWESHIANLAAWRTTLNEKRYRELAYSGPGTDLRVGLPDGHVWLGGRGMTQSGHPFVPNLPTEEVFTLPDRERIEGTVRSTKPLNYGGTLIDDFHFEIEGGRVVKAQAGRGDEILQRMIGTDEGAARFGEVALVPHSSPISQSGLLFLNTLYDENASSHLALGKAYRTCCEGATGTTDEAFNAMGGNTSLIHVDFMIGSGELDIDGISADGAREPLMRRGEWVPEFAEATV